MRDETLPLTASLSEKERYRWNKLHKRLRRLTGQAIEDFSMIQDGDRIMVCVSGGKDSFTLLDLLISLQRNAPVDFDLIAVNLDQKQPGFPEDVLPAYFKSQNIPYHIIEQDTYSIVQRVVPEGKTTCGLCSRLRRGLLYRYAGEHGITKIALGHHRDDIIETFFLNLFFGGKMKAMPAKLLSDDKRHMVIRPLAYCREKEIARYAQYRQFPIIPCNLCGSQENLQRQSMKTMLENWDLQHPGRVETIFTALQDIAPSQLLDQSLFNFKDLEKQRNLAPQDSGEALTTPDLFSGFEPARTESPVIFQPRRIQS